MKTYTRFNRRVILERLTPRESVRFVGWAELATRTMASAVAKREGFKLSVHRFPDDEDGNVVIGVYRHAEEGDE